MTIALVRAPQSFVQDRAATGKRAPKRVSVESHRQFSANGRHVISPATRRFRIRLIKPAMSDQWREPHDIFRRQHHAHTEPKPVESNTLSRLSDNELQDRAFESFKSGALIDALLCFQTLVQRHPQSKRASYNLRLTEEKLRKIAAAK